MNVVVSSMGKGMEEGGSTNNCSWGVPRELDVSLESKLSVLKGTVARDFLPLLFSIKRTYLGP
jgi:hypothetical protein